MTDNQTLGPFYPDRGIRLMRYPNGGWVIHQEPPEPGLLGTAIGAYSNAHDMLAALTKCLMTEPPK